MYHITNDLMGRTRQTVLPKCDGGPAELAESFVTFFIAESVDIWSRLATLRNLNQPFMFEPSDCHIEDPLCDFTEYCAPVWRNSAHTNLVDVQLNNTVRTITGSVRCTRTDWLPVLSNIAPADIRRELATSKMILRARGKTELPLLTDIDFHPRPRLQSRRPIWSNLPDEALTIQDLWRTRWQNKTVDVPNKSLIKDPTIQLPGMDLPRGQWSLLNRFRTDAGPCRNSMHEWGYIALPLCDCREHQTMRHVVNECPLTCFDGSISELHLAHDAAFNWLLIQHLRS